jgi:hypothetical protein
MWWNNSGIGIPRAAGYLGCDADGQTSSQEHTAKNPSRVGYCRLKVRCSFHVFIPLFLFSLLFVLPFTEVLQEIRRDVTRKVGVAALKG